MNLLLVSLSFGLVTAAILALGTVAFTLQFAVTNIFNLTFATIMTLSALIAYSLVHAGLPLWLAIIAGSLAGGLLTAALNRFLFRPFIRHGHRAVGMIIVTFGVSVIIEYVTVIIWGSGFFSIEPSAQQASVHALGMIFTYTQLWIMALAVVCMALVHVLLRYTRIGKAMRATAENPPLARACGVRTGRVIDLAWLASGVLCGLSGIVLALSLSTFSVYSELEFLVIIIAAAALGGIGQAYGAMAGAVVVGIATELGALYIDPSYKEVIAFIILGLVLFLRPQGIFAGTTMKEDVST